MITAVHNGLLQTPIRALNFDSVINPLLVFRNPRLIIISPLISSAITTSITSSAVVAPDMLTYEVLGLFPRYHLYIFGVNNVQYAGD